MRIVIALGGNALLQRGEPLESAIQHKNIISACKSLAQIAAQNQVILTHGNGPQIGLLALQNDAYKAVTPYPLYVLGAQTEGMIGSLFAQELKNHLPQKEIVCLLTHTVVDSNDPGFMDPTKFIGPTYDNLEQVEHMAKVHNWVIKPDGKYFRRVVSSPKPRRILEAEVINYLLKNPSTMLVCTGGGGVPVLFDGNKISGIDAVIDKDRASSLLATSIRADGLIILSDVEAVETKFGDPSSRKIKIANPEALRGLNFAAGSMGPKIESVLEFVNNGGEFAAIGQLDKAQEILDGTSGTTVTTKYDGIQYY